MPKIVKTTPAARREIETVSIFRYVNDYERSVALIASGQINVKPDQIKYVGISHYHGDHTGQVGSFTDANPTGAASDYTVSINWGDGPAQPVAGGAT